MEQWSQSDIKVWKRRSRRFHTEELIGLISLQVAFWWRDFRVKVDRVRGQIEKYNNKKKLKRLLIVKEDHQTSIMPTSSCSSCRPVPVALEPLEATSIFTSSSCSSSPSLLPSPLRVRRPRRVLYPASQSRRPPMREAPDQARRWLLLLSALVFLQIYTEETHSCTGWVAHIDTQKHNTKTHCWVNFVQM